MGSLPGAVLGTVLLSTLNSRFGAVLNTKLASVIGGVLLAVGLFSLGMDLFGNLDEIKGREKATTGTPSLIQSFWIGMVGGILVSVTSVGSGSLMIVLLILVTNRPPSVLVGTDIFHAMILATFSALLHSHFDAINFRLVAYIFAGSLAGVVLGVRVTGLLGPTLLRRVFVISCDTQRPSNG